MRRAMRALHRWPWPRNRNKPMPQTAALARDVAPGRYPIDEFLAAIAGIEAAQRPGKMRSFVPQRT